MYENLDHNGSWWVRVAATPLHTVSTPLEASALQTLGESETQVG